MSQASALQISLRNRPTGEQAAVLAKIARLLRDRLASSDNQTAEADAGIVLIERLADGENVSGRAFSDAVYSDQEQGVLRRLNDEADPEREVLWNALTTALMYAAWLAYRRSGERMPEDVLEVDEATLDMLDEQWRESGTYDVSVLPSR